MSKVYAHVTDLISRRLEGYGSEHAATEERRSVVSVLRTWRAAQAAKKAQKYFQAVCKACTGGRKRQLFPCAKCGERKDITAYEERAWRHREHRSPTCIGCSG